MHLTPTFLDGVMLALNAVPDLCAVLDSHRCEMERVFKLDTVHDRYATLGGDGPYARNRRVFAVNWKQARDATGTEEQLLETLQAVAELHPGKPIAVLRGFVSLLVHTDIEGVVAMLEGEVSNPLVPIDQYSTDEDWIDGFRQVERSILRMVTGEGGSDEPLVSGFFLQRLEGDETGNRQAVDDLWTRAGLPERRWAMAGSPLVDTKRAPEAPLIRFPYSAPAREGGDEENVLRLDLPIGLERTSGVLRAAAERFGEPVDSRQFVDVIEQLGLAGEVPYTVTPDTGEVLDTKLLLTVKASDGAFSAKITKAPLPVDGLTVKVMGVNNNWSAGIWGRDNRILSRAGGRDGVVWANIDISRDRDVFIGNLIFCDQPNLVLTFLEGNQERSVFQAHNPTDEAIIATVRSHPRFDRVRPIRRDIRVPAGTTVEVVCE